ncbi:MAG: ferritin-like domain-containing protein [Chloroflexota bacterium]|nr:ferritin-like domain-containing protein [Chloroflexota bacterium]
MTVEIQSWTDRLMAAMTQERSRIASRRAFLTGTAKMVGGGALALTVAGRHGPLAALGQEATPAAGLELPGAPEFTDDFDVLNYALTLEHLEATFYREGLNTFAADDFDMGVYANLLLVRDHEATHVNLLTNTITQLGGVPVPEGEYDFGYGDSVGDFLEVAAALENTGVSAYDGAGAAIQNVDLLAVAGQIVAVEARHASYLNYVNGENPFPMAFEEPLSRDEVLEIAGPFIVAS